MSRLKNLVRNEDGVPPLAGGHSLCQGCGIPAGRPHGAELVRRGRSSSSTRPAASRSRRRGSRRRPGTCPGCTSRSRTRPRSPAASRPRSGRLRRRNALPEGEELGGRRLRRRRRHLRHRPPGAVGRPRARPPLPVRLLRQRGVHEHRHPALGGHAVRRLDHHQPLGRRELRQGAAAQGHDRDRDRPPRSLRRPGRRLALAGPEREGRARRRRRRARRSSTC